MAEWINPKYTQVMAAYRRMLASREETGRKPAKAFLIPQPK